MSKLKARDSGVELLKIFAMLIIVSFHVTQTLTYQMINGTYVFDFTMTGQGVAITTISALLYNNTLGNFIFFACSSWFLIDSPKSNKKKIFNMIFDLWIISIIALVTAHFIMHIDISIFEVIWNIFPVTYKMNWYITAYALFYAIHPLLNGLINNMDQSQHLRLAFVIIFIYQLFENRREL